VKTAKYKSMQYKEYNGERPLVWWSLFLKQLFPEGSFLMTEPKFRSTVYPTQKSKHGRK
jgi:hypothetical protein